MKIAALQISSIGLGQNRLDYYLRICDAKGIRVLLLGEYVLNRFFHELPDIPKNMILQQTNTQLEALKQLSKIYNVAIVAPVVRVLKEKVYKSVAVVRNSKTSFYNQQILINYRHWNEERFFDNELQELKAPQIFRVDEFRFGVLPAFETHFDYFWQQFMKKDVDVVLVPSVNTFNSGDRWQELLKMRAFVNSCYLLRANRIGEYKDKNGHSWEFYGESMFINPEGEVVDSLKNSEEMLIAALDKDLIKEARSRWGFKAALKKRGAL